MHADGNAMAVDRRTRTLAGVALAGPVAAYSLVLIAWLGPAVNDARSARALTVAFAVAVVAPVVLALALPLEALADRAFRRLATSPVGSASHPDAVEIALGLRDPRHLRLRATAAVDVIGLPTSAGPVVIVSTGALDAFDNAHLRALINARLTAMRDPWARLATHGALAWWALRFVLPLAMSGFVLGAPSAALIAVGLFGVVIAAPTWPETLRELRADVVAIAHAPDRGSLGDALLHLPAVTPVDESPLLAPPRLAGGRMTRNAGGRDQRRYVGRCLLLLREFVPSARTAPVASDAPTSPRNAVVPVDEPAVDLTAAGAAAAINARERANANERIGNAGERAKAGTVVSRAPSGRELRREWAALGGHLVD
ncbi:MAG: hypothetical protein AAGC53_18495 [Actinomycetota bacterium]